MFLSFFFFFQIKFHVESPLERILRIRGSLEKFFHVSNFKQAIAVSLVYRKHIRVLKQGIHIIIVC